MLLCVNAVGSAEGWRRIVPLHSTRADVERLLGHPPAPPTDGTRIYSLNKGRSIYFTDEGEVYVVYANDFFGSEAINNCLKKVPLDTVLFIQVTPKTNLQLSDLHLDKAALRTFEPSSPPNIGYEGFIDDVRGMVVRTFKGRVDQIAYIANSDDRALCPVYYENIEGALKLIVDFIPRKFDEYGTIRFADEKARLDNLAIQLQNEPEAVGYLIFYSGRNLAAAASKARANRAKNYLAMKRGMKRIVIIDGGRREQFVLELYVQHRDLPPPTPYPDSTP